MSCPHWFFLSTRVKLGVKDVSRQFSIGGKILNRVGFSRGRVILHDKSTHRQLKKPEPNSSLTRSITSPSDRSHIFRRTLLQCGAFTFVSVNAIFAGSMIWNYENWKTRISKRRGGFRKVLYDCFTTVVGRPPKSSDIFWVIAFANFVVFFCNNVRSLGPIFIRYFANSPYGPWPSMSMLLSIFSHQMFFHMFLNMYVLHNFTQPLVRILGMEQFFAVFLGGGIFASFLSALVKAARGSRIPSIGASGAVCAVLSTFCMLEPQAQLCIPLVVNVIPHAFSAGSACLVIAAFEACGTVLLARRSPIDHAAHLGGLLFGMSVS